MQRQEVEVVPADSPHLEVCKQFLGCNRGVQQVTVLQFMDPGVGDDGEHKLFRLPSCRFGSGAIGVLCLVRRLGLRTDDGRTVVVNSIIVGPDSCGLGELLPLAGDVSSLCFPFCHTGSEVGEERRPLEFS